MNTTILDLLRKRRSIRKFADRPVDADKVEGLIEAAVRSPTSRGNNPWEFIVIDDAALITQLAKAKQHGSAFLTGAPLAIVVAANPGKSDVWTEDCAIAAITIQLAAEEMGLGSCWVQIRLRQHAATVSSEDYLKKLLGLPASYTVACVIGIGYPGEEKAGHDVKSLPFAQVHRNRFTV